MKKAIFTGILALTVFCFSTGIALACQAGGPTTATSISLNYDSKIVSLADLLDGCYDTNASYQLSNLNGQSFTITGVGYEASWNDSLTIGGVTISNYETGTANEAYVSNFNSNNVSAVTNGSALPSDANISNYLELYLLTDNWKYNEITYSKGTYILGFNDTYGKKQGDRDFDDLIVAITPSAVPVPGTLLILGTGLLGIAGVRRRK